MTTPAHPTRPTGYASGATFGDPPQTAAPARDDMAGTDSRALKQAGQETAATAMDEAKKVASTTSEQVSQVSAEAGAQVRHVVDESLAEVRTRTDSQMTRLGERLREIADEVRQMASASEQHGVASQFAGDLAGRGGRVADWLESHGPDEALTEVRRYARRNPATFLAVAAGAGLVVGRFARALQEGDPDQGATGHYRSSTAQRSHGGSPGGSYGQDGPDRADNTPYDPYAQPAPGPAAASRSLADSAQIWDDQR